MVLGGSKAKERTWLWPCLCRAAQGREGEASITSLSPCEGQRGRTLGRAMEPPLHLLTQHLLPAVSLGLRLPRVSREATETSPAELQRPQAWHNAPFQLLPEWLQIQVNDPRVNHPAGKEGWEGLALAKQGGLSGTGLRLRESPLGSSRRGRCTGSPAQHQSRDHGITEVGKDLQVHRVHPSIPWHHQTVKRAFQIHHFLSPLLPKPWLLLQAFMLCPEGSPFPVSPPQKLLWNTNQGGNA